MSTSPTDNARRDRFLTDLLGVMAYGELSAFERYSADARYSPTLHDRAVMGRIAVLEFQHYELVSTRLAGLGVDAEEAMLPFQPAIDHFHDRTRPADWYESLMKAYVIDTVSADFYRAVSEYVEPESRQLIQQVQSAEDVTEILRARLRKRCPMIPDWRRGLPCGAGGCWGRLSHRRSGWASSVLSCRDS